MHVAVDIKVRPVTARRLWTAEAANAFIDQAIKITGLTPFGDRQVAEPGDLLMFCQLIAESHIAGHLDRRAGRGWVDVFSCGDVDQDLVAGAVRRYLLGGAAYGLRVQVLERGILP